MEGKIALTGGHTFSLSQFKLLNEVAVTTLSKFQIYLYKIQGVFV